MAASDWADPPQARAHLNLIASSRQLLELDPGAVVEAGRGWDFYAGSPAHPLISNAAFRSDDRASAEELVSHAQSFFGERGRGFSVWVRGDLKEDADLVAAAEAKGHQPAYEMPEMVLAGPVDPPALPAGAELRRLRSSGEAEDYWRVAAASYLSLGFPAEVFAFYTNHRGLLADNVAAFVVYLDGKPVSIAMTIVSHGVAGIYWVGSLEEARGRGLGRAVTAAATNAGFDLGADVASLQASPMGAPIYADMGYETIFDYRLLMSPPP
jgi:ribosomal protein S18 acetylase RimI-like enzyme